MLQVRAIPPNHTINYERRSTLAKEIRTWGLLRLALPFAVQGIASVLFSRYWYSGEMQYFGLFLIVASFATVMITAIAFEIATTALKKYPVTTFEFSEGPLADLAESIDRKCLILLARTTDPAARSAIRQWLFYAVSELHASASKGTLPVGHYDSAVRQIDALLTGRVEFVR